MLEYLRLRKVTSVLTSIDIRVDFPDLRYPPGFTILAGILLVPLSVSGSDFIVFFRKSQRREVKWAGNPYEKFIKQGTEGYLEPRKSFKTWSETVIGKCREWTEEQIETAAVLCLVYGKFIEVWRQKEAALQNSQLTRLLLANSAHEVRTPLNAIINYLEIALEGSIDTETRDNLAKSHSASKSLIYVINDLLDLTKTEEGHNLIKDEIFDLPATVREATDSFVGDAKRKSIKYEVVENPSVPQYVVGDQRRLRQAISNVTANAIQNTSQGFVKVETCLAERSESRVEIEIIVQDTGIGMSPEKLDALFRDLEQVQSENDEDLNATILAEPKTIKSEEEQTKTLGLGLALVARIVRNMNGQLRLKSEEGKGSRFVIQLGFELPSDNNGQAMLEGAIAAGVGPPTNQPATPPMEKGELLLVNKSAQKSAQKSITSERKEMVRQTSSESLTSLKSMNSMKSFNSGKSAGSDIDRLITAIQEPHMIAKSPRSRDSGRKERSRSAGRRRPGSSGTTTNRTGSFSGSLRQGSASQEAVHHTSILKNIPGESKVTDSKTPIKPIRMSDEPSQDQPIAEPQVRTPSKVTFEATPESQKQTDQRRDGQLHVLVAEDDPINSRIMNKRLEKSGHAVHLTVNGEECSSAYGEKPTNFDVVLMDMQVSLQVSPFKHCLMVLSDAHRRWIDFVQNYTVI